MEKMCFEDAGVMPNPTVQKLQEGCKIAREGKADLILAVGAVLSATMRKRFPYLHTARKIHGKNITFK